MAKISTIDTKIIWWAISIKLYSFELIWKLTKPNFDNGLFESKPLNVINLILLFIQHIVENLKWLKVL